MGSYSVFIKKDFLHFSAGHFLIFGETCERLHGHNYAVSVQLTGDLVEPGYVFDFIALKDLTKQICDRLDHKTLIPGKSPDLAVSKEKQVIRVAFKKKEFVFPSEDVFLLPIENSSSELLANYVCKEIKKRLLAMGAKHLTSIEVGVEESPGQTAYYKEPF